MKMSVQIAVGIVLAVLILCLIPCLFFLHYLIVPVRNTAHPQKTINSKPIPNSSNWKLLFTQTGTGGVLTKDYTLHGGETRVYWSSGDLTYFTIDTFKDDSPYAHYLGDWTNKGNTDDTLPAGDYSWSIASGSDSNWTINVWLKTK